MKRFTLFSVPKSRVVIREFQKHSGQNKTHHHHFPDPEFLWILKFSKNIFITGFASLRSVEKHLFFSEIWTLVAEIQIFQPHDSKYNQPKPVFHSKRGFWAVFWGSKNGPDWLFSVSGALQTSGLNFCLSDFRKIFSGLDS